MASVLNLDHFSGEIVVKDCSFQSHKLYADFENSFSPTDTQTYEDSTMVQKSGLVRQGVLVISNHSKGVTLLNSQFKHNGVITGAVVIQVSHSFTKGAFLYGNTFQANTAFFRSAGVYLLGSYSTDAPRSCTGFQLLSNSFI